MNIFNRNRNRAENPNIAKGRVFDDLVNKIKQEEGDSEKKIPQNKFFTAREWFERSYHGEKIEDLPEDVVSRSTPEEIEALMKKYAYLVSKDEVSPKDSQTDLFDQEK